MELIKEIKQSKILKNVFIALIGTILLAISSKITSRMLVINPFEDAEMNFYYLIKT